MGGFGITCSGMVNLPFWSPMSLSAHVQCLPWPMDGKCMTSWSFTQTRFSPSLFYHNCCCCCFFPTIIVILKCPQETKPGYLPCFCCYMYVCTYMYKFFFMEEKERVALLLCQAKQEHSRLALEELCPIPGKWCYSVTKLRPILWAHVLQHTRLLCPPLSPGVCSNSVHWVGDAI